MNAHERIIRNQKVLHRTDDGEKVLTSNIIEVRNSKGKATYLMNFFSRNELVEVEPASCWNSTPEQGVEFVFDESFETVGYEKEIFIVDLAKRTHRLTIIQRGGVKTAELDGMRTYQANGPMESDAGLIQIACEKLQAICFFEGGVYHSLKEVDDE